LEVIIQLWNLLRGINSGSGHTLNQIFAIDSCEI